MAGLAVSAALVSGCSSPQQANETLPSAAETSASPELEPLGPPDFPVPDEARTQDAAGAEAALRYYLDLVTHQHAESGQPLRDLSRDCSLCMFLADRADQDAAAGYVVDGGGITVIDMPTPAVDGALAEFSFSVSQGPVEVRGPDGAPVPGRGSEAAPVLIGAAAMEWSSTNRAWIVTQLFFKQP
ncbi:hypothetical protein [Geodermatophilus sp. URMC 64]